VTDDDSTFNDCFTLFLDFLGSSAATTWPRERQYEIVDLLILIAQLKSDLQIDGEAQADGSYKINVRPDITTFSDHIVVSYPSVPNEHYGEFHSPALDELWLGIVLQEFVRILSFVAERGLRIGLLVRGGFTFGQLFHGRGVVFGNAMVEAYKLESKIAVMPRIVASDALIQRVRRDQSDNMKFFERDTDGCWHLNYLAGMVGDARQHSSDIGLWRAAHLERIEQEIALLRKHATAPRGVEKWEWFRWRFEASAAG
jgi:hypothetical protein